METDPTKFTGKYHISSSRKTNWNYSTPGLYFITICTYQHNNFFGKIINNQMELSKMGLIANQCLVDIPIHFNNIFTDEFVIMPNHIHLLLNLESTSFNPVETHHDASLTKRYNNYFYHRIAIRSSQTIPLVIKQFKSAVTHQINPKTIFFAWQPRYHDIIIKNQKQYLTIKNYIKNNVINWERDKLFNKDVETPRRGVSTN